MWSIKFAGQKEGLKRDLQAALRDADPVQRDIVRDFVMAAVNRLPEEVTAVVVKAYGQREALVYQLMIKVEPIQLALDQASSVK